MIPKSNRENRSIERIGKILGQIRVKNGMVNYDDVRKAAAYMERVAFDVQDSEVGMGAKKVRGIRLSGVAREVAKLSDSRYTDSIVMVAKSTPGLPAEIYVHPIIAVDYLASRSLALKVYMYSFFDLSKMFSLVDSFSDEDSMLMMIPHRRLTNRVLLIMQRVMKFPEYKPSASEFALLYLVAHNDQNVYKEWAEGYLAKLEATRYGDLALGAELALKEIGKLLRIGMRRVMRRPNDFKLRLSNIFRPEKRNKSRYTVVKRYLRR